MSWILTAAIVVFVVLRFVMRFNSLLRSGRAYILILVLSCVLAMLGGVFIYLQFIVNKGPNDVGATWHMYHALSEKYGPQKDTAGGTPMGFDKDSDQSGSGTYSFKFFYDSHIGVIHCHYDKNTGKFDHDEIIPDK